MLKRDERIARLVQQERWSESESVFGLPKVKVRTVGPSRPGRKAEKAEPSEAVSEGETQAEGSAQ